MRTFIIFFFSFLWCAFIWGGTTFLISERGWSGWWFVLTFILTVYPNYTGGDKNK